MNCLNERDNKVIEVKMVDTTDFFKVLENHVKELNNYEYDLFSLIREFPMYEKRIPEYVKRKIMNKHKEADRETPYTSVCK